MLRMVAGHAQVVFSRKSPPYIALHRPRVAVLGWGEKKTEVLFPYCCCHVVAARGRSEVATTLVIEPLTD